MSAGRKIPQGEVDVMLAKREAGYTDQEIGEALGRHRGTINARLRKEAEKRKANPPTMPKVDYSYNNGEGRIIK